MTIPDRYKAIGAEFSGGGMSQADVFDDTHLDRRVLIKRLQSGINQSRLLDEIAALTAIRSKHVVQIYDVLRGNDGIIYGLVEEFLSGSDLNTSLPITDLRVFLRTVYAIACGISDIHESGHVHRDIKPGNMKFDGEDCLKIFDFGLSRPDDVNASTVGTVGTPGYLAPELCVDDKAKVSFSQPVDVFAFGATVVKMLRGTLPYGLRQLPPVLPCIEADCSAFPIGLPASIAEVFNRCLSYDPSNRPKMAEVRSLLAAYLKQGQHRATLVSSNKVYTLDASNPVVVLKGGALGSIQIKYDGLSFVVSQFTGAVSINNIGVSLNQSLPGSCVIILGDISAGPRRLYFTVDVSYPEVVL